MVYTHIYICIPFLSHVRCKGPYHGGDVVGHCHVVDVHLQQFQHGVHHGRLAAFPACSTATRTSPSRPVTYCEHERV